VPGFPSASVSSVKLGDGVDAALRELQDSLDESPHADEVLSLFRKHYQRDATWVDAFAGVMSELLPELVLIDPSDEVLAAHVRGVHQRAFDECDEIARVLRERQRALEAAGFDVQVHVREASPLSFVHPDGRAGPRFRVERCAEGWRVVGSERIVEPQHLSTSALLRPIVQDTLLPTAAIIGGPGELNYFAQMPPLYAHFGLPMPMVMPRARFRAVESRAASQLKKLKLTPEDVEAPFATVMHRVMPVSPELTPELLERRLLDAIAPVLDAVPQLDDAVKRTRATMARAASRLAGRYAAAQRTRDEVLVSQVKRLQSALFPHDEPQERVLGFPAFAAKSGIARFSSMVLESVVPFSTSVQTLWPLVVAGVAEAS
jgi:bacillithiol biosynthesis cysteine-adding enzyme BshC